MSRPRLLLLPGLLSDATAWRPVAERLADAAEIAIPDFSGHDSLAGMARAALDAVPGPLAVAGHSMGARVALEMLRLAPARVERLALVDTGTHPVRPGEPEKRQEVIDLAWREGMAALADRWLPPMVHPARRADAAFLAPLREMVLRYSPAQHEGQIRALLGRRDAVPLLAGIACPTLIAVGRQDEWSPPAQHEAMLAHVPQARLVVIEEAGHFAPYEQPGATAAALREWLAG